jgi:hypothetical protein
VSGRPSTATGHPTATKPFTSWMDLNTACQSVAHRRLSTSEIATRLMAGEKIRRIGAGE